MPILPLNYPEPFAATLGVMHYPAVDEADPPRARAFTAQFLAAALKGFQTKGGIVPCDVTDLLIDAGQPLTDFKERQWCGEAIGELFKTYFALANTDPMLASWKHAIKIVEFDHETLQGQGRSHETLGGERSLHIGRSPMGRPLNPRSMVPAGPWRSVQRGDRLSVFPGRSRNPSSVGAKVATIARKERAPAASGRLECPRRMGTANIPAGLASDRHDSRD